MTFRETRCHYSLCVSRLMVIISETQFTFGKVEVAFDEGGIHNPRRVRLADGTVTKVEDAVHKKGSRHYDMLGVDLLVYINGEYVNNGDHPIWAELDVIAKGIDPKLSFGIEFRDANHLSWDEGD